MIKKIGLSVVLAAFVASCLACQRVALTPEEDAEQKEKEMITEDTTLPSSVNVATIAINSGGKTVNVNAEMAVTNEERARGLQGRESLAKNAGMWFVFQGETHDAFWMKDTFIPLDIIFVGPDMKVVDIIENTVPKSTDLLISKVPYQYVLEVEAGFVSDNDVKIGDELEKRIGPK
jgi:uncharacterized membrane protein (UPF0127 family)